MFAVVALWLTACNKKEDPKVGTNPPPPVDPIGKVKLEFTHAAGVNPLILDTVWYQNANGDSFTVSMFKYYISNIQLSGDDTTNYTERESYHLLNEGDASSKTFDLPMVPNGTYTRLSFMIGVDSIRNVSGAQTGALDPLKGMFWTWNTGYIFMKFEGQSPRSTAPNKSVVIHIGGYKGAYRGQRTVLLTLPNPLVVNDNHPHVHLRTDLLELFKSPNTIDFSQDNELMTPNARSKAIADNYSKMIYATLVESE